MKKTFVLLTTFLFVPLTGRVEAKDKPFSDKVWIVIKPIQCLGNPLEKEWLAKHENKGTDYPRQKEGDLIKSYFARKKIPVIEMRELKYIKGDPLSSSCDAPRGDTFYLMIHPDDVPKMVRLGYTQRLPASDVPKKK